MIDIDKLEEDIQEHLNKDDELRSVEHTTRLSYNVGDSI